MTLGYGWLAVRSLRNEHCTRAALSVMNVAIRGDSANPLMNCVMGLTNHAASVSASCALRACHRALCKARFRWMASPCRVGVEFPAVSAPSGRSWTSLNVLERHWTVGRVATEFPS